MKNSNCLIRVLMFISLAFLLRPNHAIAEPPPSKPTLPSESASEKMAAVFEAGMDVSQLTNSGSASSRTGLTIGGLIEIPLTPMFSLVPELQYSQLGASDTLTIAGVSVSGNVALNYLRLPVTFRGNLTVSPEAKLFAFAGPSVGLALSRNLNVTALGNSGSIELGPYSKSVDFGFDFGVGGNYALNSDWAIEVTARYYLGLLDTLTDVGQQQSNRAFMFLAGVRRSF